MMQTEHAAALNPIGESCHYPGSDKWLVRSPESRLIRFGFPDGIDGETSGDRRLHQLDKLSSW